MTDLNTRPIQPMPTAYANTIPPAVAYAYPANSNMHPHPADAANVADLNRIQLMPSASVNTPHPTVAYSANTNMHPNQAVALPANVNIPSAPNNQQNQGTPAMCECSLCQLAIPKEDLNKHILGPDCQPVCSQILHSPIF
jgi:hypothetical protein